MSRNDCLRIISEASEFGVKQLALSGGEPLEWKHISEAIDLANTNGMTTTIYTTGNVENFYGMIKTLKENGLQRVIFSLFGSTTEMHERVTRIAGSFANTMNAIKDSVTLGMEAELHFVPMATNYKELRKLVLLGSKIGINNVSVLRLVPQGRAALLTGRTLSKIQNQELSREIKKLREEGYCIRTGSPYNFLNLSENPKCCAAIDRLIVGPDLRIYPCDAFKQIKAEEIVGTSEYSILKDKSLAECWEESPYLNKIREYLTTPFAEPCSSCKMLEKCLSGCMAQKYIAIGKLEKRADPDCLCGKFKE